MVINTDKTKVMLITSRQKRYHLQIDDLKLNLNNSDLRMFAANEKVFKLFF